MTSQSPVFSRLDPIPAEESGDPAGAHGRDRRGKICISLIWSRIRIAVNTLPISIESPLNPQSISVSWELLTWKTHELKSIPDKDSMLS